MPIRWNVLNLINLLYLSSFALRTSSLVASFDVLKQYVP